MFVFTRFLLFSHKIPTDFMNYLRFLAAFFILSVCFSCKTKEVKPNASKYVKIPDINFEKAFIELKIDDVQDGQILTINAEKEDSLDIYNKNIKSLEGIEAFKNLSFLNCFFNELTNLDVSENLKLKALYCGCNRLTTLYVRKNVILENLGVENNFLENLDLSKNAKLILLSYSSNNLSNLDVSQNTLL